MPRSPYTRTRRNVMTALMWVILGVTIVMAAAVTQKQKRLSRVDLGKNMTTVGNVTVRLPAKWRPRSSADEDDTRIVARASEGTPGDEGRELRVLSERLESPMSPMQYLISAFNVEIPIKFGKRTGIEVLSEVEIAGYPGLLITSVRPAPQFGLDGEAAFQKRIYACVILPSLQAIVVQMTGGQPGDDGDADMVRQIARAITVNKPPQLEQPGATVMLSEGISFTPPPSFAAVAMADPNRIERRLWMAHASSDSAALREGRWTVIETVGVLFPPADMLDGQERARALDTLRTVLLVRDQRWRGADPSIEGNVLRVDAPADRNLFPARAYLVPHDSGRALLTIFHGGFDSEEQFDAAWAQIAKSVKFLPATGAKGLAELGAEEAQRLRARAPKELLPDRGEQWWLWTDQSDRPHRGWSHIEFDESGASIKSESRVRRWGGRIGRVTEEWSTGAGAGTAQKADVTRTVLASDGSDLESVRQTVEWRSGQVEVTAQSRIETLAQWTVSVPPQYIAGAVLPQVIGRLARNPMVLQSESFPGHDALGTPRPLDVIIRPAENSARRTENDQPLRCVTAQVNGSGVVSRWYIRDDDTIARIEFADGVQCIPTDKKAIGFSFAKDGQMSPP